MALMETIARWFGLSRSMATDTGSMPASAANTLEPTANERDPARYTTAASGSADAVDDIDADVIDDTPDIVSEPRPIVVPKSRAELIEELKKNYSEVLTLVRKVDTHLDEQRGRADRMLSIAEESSRKLDALPELAQQTGRVADAIVELVELTKKGQNEDKAAAEKLAKTAIQQLEAAQQQTSVLTNVSSAVRESGEASRELSTSVVDMTKATGELSTKIETMRETDAAREEELTRLVKSSQRGLIILVVITGALAVGTLLAVVFRVGG